MKRESAFTNRLLSAARWSAVCPVIVSITMMVAYGSDVIPGAPQKKPVVLKNGVIHTITGATIENGALVFDKGVITEVGTAVTEPKGAEVIDLKGRHVYPSLMESHSQLGLTEISSVRATIDTSETGEFNPNVKAHLSVNPDSELIPVTRANGVLLALSAPAGGTVSGKAAVLQLDGWTYEDMTLKPEAAMIVNWPRLSSASSRRSRSGETESESPAADPLKNLREFFEQSRAYLTARQANPSEQAFDIRLDAMGPVLDGKMPLLVAASRVREIQSAVAFSVEQNVKLILFGGHDADQCADLLRQYNIPVIVDAVHRAPSRRDDDYDAAYSLPERLRQAGIRFCISGSARNESWNTRNLPYHAATSVAYGLPHDDALRAVTIWPAEILGVADRVGSLDKGKDATLFVCDGDPLETETHVERAWIQGRKVDLRNRHTQLFEKYSEKYRQLKAAGR